MGKIEFNEYNRPRVTMNFKAMRKNKGKPKLHYVLELGSAMKELARIFEFGALKYEDGNWKNGFPKKDLLDSALRHTMDFAEGKEKDEESGLHSLAHAVWNLSVLLKQEMDRRDNNEEPPKA